MSFPTTPRPGRRRAGPAVVAPGEQVYRTAAVPFLVELPDGQGWLVAAQGRTLSWRTGGGPWTGVGANAALLPAAATEVRAGGRAMPLP